MGTDGQMITEIAVPAGTDLVVHIPAINTSPELWGEDAGEWKPERWLAPLVEIAKNTEGDLTALVEANVRAQVANIVKTDVIQHEWTKRDVQVHGWVYELETGRLRDLGITVGKNTAA